MASHIRNLSFSQPNYYRPNSTVVITGAGSGIGENVAYLYAERECKLVLIDRNEEQVKRVEKKCVEIMKRKRRINDQEAKQTVFDTNTTTSSSSSSASSSSPPSSSSFSLSSCPLPLHSTSPRTLCITLDVTSPSSCSFIPLLSLHFFHSIDILVLCAGIGAHHLFKEKPDQTERKEEDFSIFHRTMNINYFGYLYCLHSCYSPLIDSNGLVIAITSFSGEVGLPYRTAYCASKFAVTGLLEALRSEMKVLEEEKRKEKGKGKEGEVKESFHITIVCPPTINTNLRKNSLSHLSSLQEKDSPSALSVEQCARVVVEAGDRRLRKALFPFKSFLAYYLRPLVPDVIDQLIMAKAKL